MRKRDKIVKHKHSLTPLTSGLIGAGLLSGIGGSVFGQPTNRKVKFFEFTEAHKLGFLLGSLDVCKECKTKIKKMVNNDL